MSTLARSTGTALCMSEWLAPMLKDLCVATVVPPNYYLTPLICRHEFMVSRVCARPPRVLGHEVANWVSVTSKLRLWTMQGEREAGTGAEHSGAQQQGPAL